MRFTFEKKKRLLLLLLIPAHLLWFLVVVRICKRPYSYDSAQYIRFPVKNTFIKLFPDTRYQGICRLIRLSELLLFLGNRKSSQAICRKIKKLNLRVAST